MQKLKMLDYFKYDHLPEHLQDISKPFSELANQIWKSHEENQTEIAETKAAIRKILEAKDCIVRSHLK